MEFYCTMGGHDKEVPRKFKLEGRFQFPQYQVKIQLLDIDRFLKSTVSKFFSFRLSDELVWVRCK